MVSKIQVLLSYYNGEEFINQQVESILNQQGELEIGVLIRDDGSPTPLSTRIPQLEVETIQGKNLGPKGSFLELLRSSQDYYEYFAFSDQDDWWEKDKLESAVQQLEKYEEPALYISKTRLVDLNLNQMGLDNFESGAFTFGRVLIKNNGVGCTMVLNKKLRDIVNEAQFESRVPELLHDHLIYMICLGVGGKVVYDSIPHILYRQHGNNVIGNRSKLKDKLKDNGFFDSKRIRFQWCKEIYENYSSVFTSENKVFLEKILTYDNTFINRVKLCINNNFDTRSVFEKINLYLLILFKKY